MTTIANIVLAAFIVGVVMALLYLFDRKEHGE